MNFLEALKLAVDGKLIISKGFTSKHTMFVSKYFKMNKDGTLKDSSGNSVRVCSDLLKEDWEESELRIVSFAEAREALMKGKKIHSLKTSRHYTINDINDFPVSDLCCNEWIILTEGDE